MAILQVRDLDDKLYSSLKTIAKQENRSISQEVITILEKYISNPSLFDTNPTKDFLSLSGSWDDNRSSEEIIKSIKKNRKNSKRFDSENALFD
ncbi:MAG: antitoxin [Candidatus Latescibacteria bacterium]|nr:antitoxin [Candidatus Latescibacterota bacterium]